jgi:hypothetical protein
VLKHHNSAIVSNFALLRPVISQAIVYKMAAGSRYVFVLLLVLSCECGSLICHFLAITGCTVNTVMALIAAFVHHHHPQLKRASTPYAEAALIQTHSQHAVL